MPLADAPGPARPDPYAEDDRLAHFALAVFRANGALMRNGERLTGASGQSSARWQVLGRAHERARTVARMAHEMGLARQSVQTVANALRDAGLVSFIDNPTDRRAQLVTTTPRGADVLREIETRNAAWAARLAPLLSADDLEQATILLHRIASVIESDLTEREEPR